MITIFRSADAIMRMFGYRKTEEDSERFVIYERHWNEKYTQVIALARKASGEHLIMSYEKGVVYPNGFFRMVGIPHKAAKACVKKIKELGW